MVSSSEIETENWTIDIGPFFKLDPRVDRRNIKKVAKEKFACSIISDRFGQNRNTTKLAWRPWGRIFGRHASPESVERDKRQA